MKAVSILNPNITHGHFPEEFSPVHDAGEEHAIQLEDLHIHSYNTKEIGSHS